MIQALQKIIIGLQIFGGSFLNLGNFFRSNDGLDLICNAPGHLQLQLKNITGFSFISLRPKVLISCGIDQLDIQ